MSPRPGRMSLRRRPMRRPTRWRSVRWHESPRLRLRPRRELAGPVSSWALGMAAQASRPRELPLRPAGERRMLRRGLRRRHLPLWLAGSHRAWGSGCWLRSSRSTEAHLMGRRQRRRLRCATHELCTQSWRVRCTRVVVERCGLLLQPVWSLGACHWLRHLTLSSARWPRPSGPCLPALPCSHHPVNPWQHSPPLRHGRRAFLWPKGRPRVTQRLPSLRQPVRQRSQPSRYLGGCPGRQGLRLE
mmetsp:Transcript_117744/g.327943  ORF Transcript_117744/g.327943 Transcript_117744/m.327943 type:complete len:244 (-) Transcript_117744:1286-2017(-)